MRRLSQVAVLSGLVAVAFVAAAHAQSSLGIGTAEVTVQPSGAFGGIFVEIARIQRAFFTSLREALIAIRGGEGGALWLVGLSFVYGIFHAAGPGHGKAVISAYMVANEVQLRRGIALSLVSSLLQAVSALVLVIAGWYILRGTALSMTDAAYYLELASYGMIAAVGLWMLIKKARSLNLSLILPRWSPRPVGGSHALAFAGSGTFTDRPAAGPRATPFLGRASEGFGSEICDDPAGDACDCGRTHMPDPTRLTNGSFGLRSAASTVLAVGLRPCSGAIVVLTFCLMNGMMSVGSLSVLSMALGTAITVSLLASAAVLAKDVVLRLGSRRPMIGRLRGLLEIAGAALLLLLGVGLLLGALQA